MTEPKLPLWRLITGFAMLAIFISVLISVAPVYVENYKLGRYVHTLASSPTSRSLPDESLRAQITQRAHELDLPVLPGDVHIDHAEGKLQLQASYHVQMNLSLYQVDLHMSAH